MLDHRVNRREACASETIEDVDARSIWEVSLQLLLSRSTNNFSNHTHSAASDGAQIKTNYFPRMLQILDSQTLNVASPAFPFLPRRS
mmetsp:Transcript_32716/g.79425  ORF Transcript_32716/g.79425 Transcript_32716/m.79425 type:complete len:87 (-) Transcript_32716:2129-2389(-)